MTSPNAILVLENHRHTLPVVRSLSRAGFRVVAGLRPGRRDDRFVRFSRAVAETWVHPDFQDREAFLEALRERLGRGDLAGIFPVGEDSLRLLGEASRRGWIPAGVRPIMTSPDVAARCLDKAEAALWAVEAGLPLAGSAEVRSLEELAAHAARLGYPVAVKPASSEDRILGRKCLLIDSAEELARAIPTWPESHASLLVQNRAPGLRHNCQFIAQGGKITRYFESRVLRTDAADGTGYGVEIVSVAPSPRRRELCEKAARTLGYEGLGCLQFMVDPASDSEIFLELNPRLDATSALPVACGMDFPRWAAEAALGRPLSGKDGPYPVGRLGAWTLGDLDGWIATGGGVPRVGRILSAALRARAHATFSALDPLPALYLWALKAASVARLAFRRATRARI